ncbi:10314_t:CDS:2 [Racocetra persica]|uniref:10314_t:CDS:1 n=1 Tax=Racocetra persica TaxID=160502 RepID=A0ACA9QGU0_9GLOM|nr:10314_t:CDS:2 [Racocetra persica]
MEDSGPSTVNSLLETEELGHSVKIYQQKGGHRGWKCNYCSEKNLCASDLNMNTHLALTCQKVPLNVKQDCLQNFLAPNKRKKIEHDIASGLQPQPPDRKALSNNWLNYETTHITIMIKKELQNEENLTLALDSWTSNREYFYFAFIIITSDKKQYVYSIKDYSRKSHTAIFTVDEIEKVLVDIGINKFSAVVSDGASAMSLAKKYILDKYPKILLV